MSELDREPPIRVVGEPRSLDEMQYIAALHRCRWCEYAGAFEYRLGGVGIRWELTTTCPGCLSERCVVFEAAGDPFAAEPAAHELGAGRSQVLTPFQLVCELDRLDALVVSDPTLLAGAAWHTNYERVERAITTLTELVKFVDGDAISDRALGEVARADRASRPERYTRQWMADRLAWWRQIAGRIAEDAPRIADDELGVDRPAARGWLDRKAVAAHQAWLARGRRGDGRLDVVTFDGERIDLTRVSLIAARLERVNLRTAKLAEVTLDEASCTAVVVDGSDLQRSSWIGARVVECSFVGADLRGSRWGDAVIERSSFVGASLDGASLAGARFVGCDFRDARLLADLERAVFEDCEGVLRSTS